MTPEPSRREFSSRRHAQRRDLFRACRDAVAGSDWGARQGVMVGKRDGWFVAVAEMTDLVREATRARVLVKPMASDPLFWDLVGHPELRRQGLSFRYFGAMTVAGLTLEEPEISEEGGVDAIARRMLALGEDRLGRIAGTWALDDFLDPIAGKSGRYHTATVATLLAGGRYDEAERLCAASAKAGSSGGFVSSQDGTFNDMVERWIAAQRAVEKPA